MYRNKTKFKSWCYIKRTINIKLIHATHKQCDFANLTNTITCIYFLCCIKVHHVCLRVNTTKVVGSRSVHVATLFPHYLSCHPASSRLGTTKILWKGRENQNDLSIQHEKAYSS